MKMTINNIIQSLKNEGHSRFSLEDFKDFNVNKLDVDILKSHFSLMPLDNYSNGNRLRNYIQVSLSEGDIKYGKFEPYQQTKKYNPITGGVIRDYESISEKILELDLFNQIIKKDIEIIKNIKEMSPISELMIGIHLFRYKAGIIPAYSSPSWLHKDDEDIVFLHLIDVSSDLIGGDNIIAKNPKKIDYVFKLKKIFDTLVVNHNCYHAVTPMGIPDHYEKNKFLHRDIILVTFQKREKDN